MAAEVLLADDDEYIDMEITSYSNFLPSHDSPKPIEFEFQMCSSSSSSSIFQDSEASLTSPADELFYKGKLLPLHLPPRLQMVENLLQNENDYALPVNFGSDVLESSLGMKDLSSNLFWSQINQKEKDHGFEEFYSTPLNTANSTPTTITPFESCNVSPSESCQVSGILNPEEYDFDCSTNTSGFVIVEKDQKKTKKQLKQYSSLGSKLRAWFGKASCKCELAYVTKVADEGSVSKARESLNKQHVKVGKKCPFGQIHRSDRFKSCNYVPSTYEEKVIRDIASENGSNRQRRSFAVGVRGRSNSKSSLNGSSSFSVLPNQSYGCQELEIGNSILGAIAHCKQSQRYFN